jgi:CHAD domain-containing protein
VRLDAKSPAGDAVRAAVAAGATRLLRHDPGVRIGDDPEDVHQARVATRRLRSALRTFRPLLDEDRVRSLREELRWAANLLGEVRDTDVLLGRLRAQSDRLPEPDRTAATLLLRRLETERDEARARLLDGFRSERYLALVECLVGFAQTPPLTAAAAEPAPVVLPSLVAPTWRKLRDAVGDVDVADPRPEQLHAVRIRAKRCRYAAEAVAPAVGKKAARLASAVADIQSLLGDHHDAHVAEGWLRDAGNATGDVAQAVAAGELIAVQRLEAAEIERRWPALWKAAARKKLRRWLD